MSHRKLTEQEMRIWEAASKHVRRMDGTHTPQAVVTDELEKPEPKPAKKQLKRAGVSLEALLSEPKKKISPQPVQNRQNERRVRRGKQAVAASFDLHGFSQDEAWRALPHFLSRERNRGSRCVIVITGKGKSGEGVLRRNFLRWIELPEARTLISGYAPAHARHGGGGAWYVYLRKPEA